MRDGNQQGAVSEGFVVGEIHGEVRKRGEMPCGGGCAALAQRIRLPRPEYGETRHCTFERKGLCQTSAPSVI